MAVLVVEDDAAVRLTLCEFLEDAGLEVLDAGDAATALTLLEAPTHDITIMVTDLNLGAGENGLVLVAKARRLRNYLRVVYETGSPEMLIGRRMRPWERTFIKPFDAGRLRDEVVALSWALSNPANALSSCATVATLAEAEPELTPCGRSASTETKPPRGSPLQGQYPCRS